MGLFTGLEDARQKYKEQKSVALVTGNKPSSQDIKGGLCVSIWTFNLSDDCQSNFDEFNSFVEINFPSLVVSREKQTIKIVHDYILTENDAQAYRGVLVGIAFLFGVVGENQAKGILTCVQ